MAARSIVMTMIMSATLALVAMTLTVTARCVPELPAEERFASLDSSLLDNDGDVEWSRARRWAIIPKTGDLEDEGYCRRRRAVPVPGEESHHRVHRQSSGETTSNVSSSTQAPVLDDTTAKVVQGKTPVAEEQSADAEWTPTIETGAPQVQDAEEGMEGGLSQRPPLYNEFSERFSDSPSPSINPILLMEKADGWVGVDDDIDPEIMEGDVAVTMEEPASLGETAPAAVEKIPDEKDSLLEKKHKKATDVETKKEKKPRSMAEE